jgi:hypothetical protein
MARDIVRYQRPVSDALHPLVYGLIALLALWFVVSVWAFFGRAGYDAFAFVVVSAFFLIAVALPFLMWRSWSRADDPRTGAGQSTGFSEWLSTEFGTSTGQRNAMVAALEILLPIMAVAFGITAFGIIFYLAASSAA